MNEPVNTYIIVPRGRTGEFLEPVQWASSLAEAQACKAEQEQTLGGEWVIAARLF